MKNNKDEYQLPIKFVSVTLSEQRSVVGDVPQVCSCIITLHVPDYSYGFTVFELWFLSENAMTKPRKIEQGYAFCYSIDRIAAYLTLLSDPKKVKVVFDRYVHAGVEDLRLFLWKVDNVDRSRSLAKQGAAGQPVGPARFVGLP